MTNQSSIQKLIKSHSKGARTIELIGWVYLPMHASHTFCKHSEYVKTTTN